MRLRLTKPLEVLKAAHSLDDVARELVEEMDAYIQAMDTCGGVYGASKRSNIDIQIGSAPLSIRRYTLQPNLHSPIQDSPQTVIVYTGGKACTCVQHAIAYGLTQWLPEVSVGAINLSTFAPHVRNLFEDTAYLKSSDYHMRIPNVGYLFLPTWFADLGRAFITASYEDSRVPYSEIALRMVLSNKAYRDAARVLTSCTKCNALVEGIVSMLGGVEALRQTYRDCFPPLPKPVSP